MKILFCTQYFPPESNAPAVRVSEMARTWTGDGHAVEVLTAFPHHPAGVIPEEYRGRAFMREQNGKTRVTRTWIYVAPNKGVLKRSFSYFSWMASSMILGSLRTARPDVVIATSPQFLCAVSGWVIARIKRRPFVLEIRDLWPESILAVGALKEGLVIRFLRRLERFLYRAADHVVVVSRPFADHIAEHIPMERITFVPNGVDLERFVPREMQRDVYAENGVAQPNRILYTGTVGMAHGLEIVLEAGERLKERDDVALVVVGDGARRTELAAEAAKRGLHNVYFLGMQPRESMPDWIAGSAAVLVHLRRTDLFEKVIPSKLFEYMGCGKAVLMGVRGPAEQIVRDAECGLSFTADDAEELVPLIARVVDHPEEARRYGMNGRRFVEQHYDRNVLARRYVSEVLVPLVNRAQRDSKGAGDGAMA